MYLTQMDKPRMPPFIREFGIEWHMKVEIDFVFMFAALLISALQGALGASQN